MYVAWELAGAIRIACKTVLRNVPGVVEAFQSVRRQSPEVDRVFSRAVVTRESQRDQSYSAGKIQ